jgi:DNA-binding protein HU-beta
MTKTELIAAIAEKTDLPKATAAKALSAFEASVVAALKSGKKVSWAGLGSFSVSERAARKGRNPQTGEEIEIAAGRGVKFKAAKALKEAIQ